MVGGSIGNGTVDSDYTDRKAERHRRDVAGARARKVAREKAAAKSREAKPKTVKRVKL